MQAHFLKMHKCEHQFYNQNITRNYVQIHESALTFDLAITIIYNIENDAVNQSPKEALTDNE